MINILLNILEHFVLSFSLYPTPEEIHPVSIYIHIIYRSCSLTSLHFSSCAMLLIIYSHCLWFFILLICPTPIFLYSSLTLFHFFSFFNFYSTTMKHFLSFLLIVKQIFFYTVHMQKFSHYLSCFS